MAITDANLAETLGILGSRVTFGGLDLGVITGFNLTPETTPYQFKSARHGALVTVKEIVQEKSLSGVFTTSNILDDDVTDLFTGGDGGEFELEVTEGALVAVRENAETGKKWQTITIDNAAVRGTGLEGEAGTDEARYGFAFTGLFVGTASTFGRIVNALAPVTP